MEMRDFVADKPVLNIYTNENTNTTQEKRICKIRMKVMCMFTLFHFG